MTPAENAANAVQHDPVRVAEEQRRSSDDYRACRRLWKTIMLAPTLEICETLLRGDHVPLERLDPKWVRRFGLRTRQAA